MQWLFCSRARFSAPLNPCGDLALLISNVAIVGGHDVEVTFHLQSNGVGEPVRWFEPWRPFGFVAAGHRDSAAAVGLSAGSG
jgi:hypothetical protein